MASATASWMMRMIIMMMMQILKFCIREKILIIVKTTKHQRHTIYIIKICIQCEKYGKNIEKRRNFPKLLYSFIKKINENKTYIYI